MRSEIARPLGLVEFDTTTNITTNNSIVSLDLAKRFGNDTHFVGWYVVVVVDSDGGTPANGLGTDPRRVTAYTASSGTLTVDGAVLVAEDEAVTCHLYRDFHPVDILRAYNRARQNVFPQIGLVRELETMVTGQRQFLFTVPSTMRRIRRVSLGNRYDAGSVPETLLTNGDFETWTNATTPGTWAVAGSGASVNQEEQTSDPRNYAVLSGNNSARLAIPVSTETTLLQTVTPSVATEGVECSVSAWVYTNVASRVSIRIAGNDGSAHGGPGGGLIKHSQNLGATATNVAAGIVASSGAAMAAFVDEAVLVLGQSEVIDRPYDPILNYEHIPSVAGASDGGLLRFSQALPEKRRIRIVGLGLLSAVTVDTSTVEIDGEQLEPLYDYVRAYLAGERANQSRGDQRVEWKRLQSEFSANYQESINGSGSIRIRPQLKVPNAVL